MSIRNRVIGIVVVIGLVAGGGVAAAVLVTPKAVQVPAPVERVQRFHAVGPSAEYSGDTGGIGSVRPLIFDVGGDVEQTAVVEVSFRYRTRGDGPFTAGITLRGADDSRPLVRPSEVELGPAPDGDWTTLRFLAPAIDPGSSYRTYFEVNSVFAGRGSNVIKTAKVLVTVELSPAAPPG